MRQLILGTLYLFIGALQTGMVHATQSCGGELGWASTEISSSVSHPDEFRHDQGQWSLLLNPTEFGWRIEMVDGNGQNLTVFAAPERPVETNPVNIAGWHFRNLNNTGPNTGDVNAQQTLRRFTFGAIAKNGGSDEFGGLGELKIFIFNLTPTEIDSRALMTSLSFTACVVWKSVSDRLNPLISADPGVISVCTEMRSCLKLPV